MKYVSILFLPSVWIVIVHRIVIDDLISGTKSLKKGRIVMP